MREIKFRAAVMDYDYNEEKHVFLEMIYFKDMEVLCSGNFIKGELEEYRLQWENKRGRIHDDYACTINKEPQDTKLIVMQYTGLKDKHGKEIYDGDIVTITYIECRRCKYIESETGLIAWSTDNACWGLKVGDDKEYYPIGWEDSEIIGNIYENPELLGASE